MKFFVSPPYPTEATVDEVAFARAIRKDFPDATVRRYPTGKITWNSEGIRATLDDTGQILELNGDIPTCTRAAVWFRKLIPTDRPLLFYDAPLSFNVEL